MNASTVSVVHATAYLSEQLTARAHQDLIETLQAYGNKMDPKTTGGRRVLEALETVTRYYSETAYGLRSGRYAFPLGTALGKTQSVVSWCNTVHEMDTGHTVLVCQELIESLIDTYRDLLDKGIPAEKVGIFHRDRKASVPCSTGDPEDYQFLLVSHQMIKSGSDVETYTSLSPFKSRDLAVWDESLIKSQSRFQSAADLAGALGNIEKRVEAGYADRTEPLDEALQYLATETAKVTDAYKALRETGEAGEPFNLKSADADKIEVWQRALGELARIDRQSAQLQDAIGDLKRFLENSQEPVRVVDLRRGESSSGVVSFELQIPLSLENVICLDASAAIRMLMDLDSTLTVINDYHDVKSFERMTIEQVRCKGGNGSWKSARVDDVRIKEIANDLTGGWLPDDSACLIIVCKGDDKKPRNRHPVNVIKRGLEKHGVDLSATVRIMTRGPHGIMQIQDRPKYEFLTWGQERATNRYRHCSHFICAGVLRRDLLELSGQTAGQLEELGHSDVTDREKIEYVQASEQFYRLQQLAGRGTSRKTTNGVAAPAWGKVYDQADFTLFIQKGLPGVTWEVKDRGKYVRAVGASNMATPTKAEIATQTILEHLDGLTPDVDQISLRALKAATCPEASREVWRAARDMALSVRPDWALKGRSVER